MILTNHCILDFVDPEGKPHHLCLLSYRIPTGFTPVIVPHGNSKSNKPFYPTLPSTKALIAQHSQASGPKHTVSAVSAKVGGIVNARSASQLPRNERQVSYIQSKVKPHASTGGDEMFQMMQQAKLGDSAGMFVRETKSSPEPAFILARDWQLDDLVRFCTISTDFSILTVDPTFNLGAFDVTPTTYRHLLLETVRSGSSPVFIGPTMVHYRKTFSTYVFFAASLIGLRPELEGIRAFGTDGEKALADGFAHAFHYAIHLTCFVHFRRNIKQQLHERGFSSDAIAEIIDDVMGCKNGDVFCEGLVDCSSHREFQQKLAVLKERWEKFDGDEFYEWFCEHKVEVIEQTMLKPIREDALLGCPPCSFTTNASETANSIIKNKVDYKQSQLLEFVEKLKQVIDDQEKEVEKAVIQRGKYRFKSQFKHLEVAEGQWYKMTSQQRKKHLDRVAHASVNIEPNSLSHCPPTSDNSLSVDVQEVASEVSIPLASLQGIWHKASELLSTSENIVSAPGCDPAARLVASRTGKRPHLVLPTKAGFKCDSDCPNFKSLGICSHTVAVAQLNDQLSHFVKCIKKAKKRPNMMKLAVHGMPSGTGKKGSRPPRKRAKPSYVEEERVDRLSTMQDGSKNPVSTTLTDITSTTTVSGVTSPSPRPPSVVPPSPHPSYPPSVVPPSPHPSYPPSVVPPSPHPSYPPSVVPPSPRPIYPLSPFTQPYSPYSSIYMPPYPPSGAVYSPPLSQQSAFTLVFITGNIAVCAGCSNRYQKPALAPDDICVKHTEWRKFTLADGTPKSKFAPAYYHVKLSCLQANWPSFQALDLVIEPEIYSKLSDTHVNCLRAFGCYI